MRLRIPVYNGINDSTVTDANAQRTHLTERRTQAIAQKNPCLGFTGLMGTDRDPMETDNGKTQLRAQNRSNSQSNTQTKASLLRHKRRIPTLVTQQYATTQQVYTRVHNLYTNNTTLNTINFSTNYVKHNTYNGRAIIHQY